MYFLWLQEHRKRLNSAIKIQAFVRSYLLRKHCKQNERDQFDSVFPKVIPEDCDIVISTLVAKLLFFYDESKDLSRLVSVKFMIIGEYKEFCGYNQY